MGWGKSRAKPKERGAARKVAGISEGSAGTSLLGEIEDADRHIGRLMSERAVRFAHFSRYAKMAIILGSLAVAIAQCINLPTEGAGFWWRLAGIGGAILVSVVTGGLLFLDDDASTALDDARLALSAARRSQGLLKQFGELLRSYTRLTELQEATRLMTATLSDAAAAPNGAGIHEELLRAAQRPLLAALALDGVQHFTLCVYQAKLNPGSAATLHLAAHRRTVECEISEARVWEEGFGAVGLAFTRRKEVIVPDTHSPELGSIYDLQPAKIEDRERYRSIIATPIILDSDSVPWGIVVATSSEPNHFSAAEDAIAIMGVRSFTQMVALGLLQETRTSNVASNPPPRTTTVPEPSASTTA